VSLRWRPILVAGLAGVVLLSALGFWLLSQVKICESLSPVQIEALVLRKAISQWQEAHGDLCPDLATLRRGGFLAADANDVDPWGTPFSWSCRPEPVVVSIGPDRVAGTLDDVMVPRLQNGAPYAP